MTCQFHKQLLEFNPEMNSSGILASGNPVPGMEPIYFTDEYAWYMGIPFMIEDFIKDLGTKYYLGKNQDVGVVLMIVSYLGDLEQFIFLIKEYNCNLTKETRSEIIFNAVKGGHVNMLDYLYKELHLTREEFLDVRVFGLAIANDRVEVIEYLENTFNPTPEEIKDRKEYCLKLSATHRNLQGLKFIHEKYGIDETEIKCQDNFVLKVSVRNKCLDIVRWLCENFSYTKEEICDKLVLREAIVTGQNDMVYFFHNFELTVQDYNFENKTDLIGMKPNMVKFLIDIGYLTSSDINEEFMDTIFREKKKEILDLLIGKFSLSRKDFNSTKRWLKYSLLGKM